MILDLLIDDYYLAKVLSMCPEVGSDRLGFFVPFALCATALLGRAVALEIVLKSLVKR